MRLLITVDTNDADYKTEVHDGLSDEQVTLVRKVATALNAFQPYKGSEKPWGASTFDHHFPTGEYGCRPDMGEKTTTQLYVETGLLTQEELDQFIGLCPYDEGGFHTITRLELSLAEQTESLLPQTQKR